MTFELPHNQWGPIYASLQKESAKYTLEELEQYLVQIEPTDPLRALWLSSIIGNRRIKEGQIA